MKYTATFENGVTAKRTSDRTYTHAVAAIKDKEIIKITWVGRPDLLAARQQQMEKEYVNKPDVAVLTATAGTSMGAKGRKMERDIMKAMEW